MMKRERIIFTLWWMMGWLGICMAHAADRDSLRIAFIADAHVQDVVGHPELVRSMEVQVQSTRLFNENYFALIAALEDVAKRGITLVVLPGDLTDNGQLVNQACVKRLLDDYAHRYGISFFVTTGNHDPQRPYGTDCTGRDFLTSSGQTITRTSDSSLANEDVAVDSQLYSAGYQEQMACYASFGFFPQANYLYWETPFSSYTYDSYHYQQARDESAIDRRSYTLCDTLTATDASYLVEPIPGLWLLAIDGSVYLPAGIQNGQMQYQGSGSGYNNVMQHKPFLLPWVKKVSEEAKRRNKQLVAFCHYPLLDFNKGASQLIGKYWGPNKFDLSRVPADSISEAFMEAGIQIHVAGHMHVNNTNLKVGKDGCWLYNIQVPSIAAGIPAYKILTLKKAAPFEVETVVLDSVPGFNSLFTLYEREYTYTSSCGKVPIWNKQLLQATNYIEFCDGYFQDLVRNRFIPKDLPPVLRDSVLQQNERGQLLANIVLDIYRLRYSGDLARSYISNTRLGQYQHLFQEVKEQPGSTAFKEQIEALEQILQCFLSDEPAIPAQ